MQTVRTRLPLLAILLILGAACGSPREILVPTPILIAGNEPLSTPTLASGPIAAPGLPTPPVTPRAEAAAGQTIGDPYIPELGNTGYDVQSYLLQLSLDPAAIGVDAAATINAVATVDNLAEIALDFVGFQIDLVTVDGVATTHSRDGKKLIVKLPRPLPTGAAFSARIAYRGQPVEEASPYVGFTDALGLRYAGAEAINTLSEPDGARYWFPCNDHPRDKALYRFEITVPAHLTAVANGRLVETRLVNDSDRPDGRAVRTFVWEHRYPMATYLALVAVGPFERIESVSPGGVPLRHYVTAEFREEFEVAISETAEAIDWLSGLFGPYPFEAFGFVAVDLPPTALETQTMVLVSNEVIGKKTAIHELAHMWFGDWVSIDSWSQVWLKEGFATYIGMMWETRDDPEALAMLVNNAEAAVALNDPQYPIGNPPPEHLLGYNTYFKGAVFLHRLRLVMGDEAFFDGVRAYLQRYGGGTASDAQFKAVMEEAAGRSLDELFTTWLN